MNSNFMFMFMFIFIALLISSSCFFYTFSVSAHSISPPLLGVHPLDETYYSTKVIKCKDGSKYFSRDRLNDDFCDCVDGTDEPGTSACPRAKFYCRNVGSMPQFIFSSHVNDRICDCCDGSDEYDGKVNCPNTCVMGGSIVYRAENDVPKTGVVGSNYVKEIKKGGHLDDMIQNIKGLKIVIILQLVFIKLLVSLCIFRWCLRSKRRRLPFIRPLYAFGFQFKQWMR